MIDTGTSTRKPLDYYLGLAYSFKVVADPDGGYVVLFPDLPGCMTQVESLEELPAMVDDVRIGWIETEYERGMEIPLPSYPQEYSGKFNVRLPKSLHRSLAEEAKAEGISLNQYVVALLSRGDAQARVETRLERIEAYVRPRAGRQPYHVVPSSAPGKTRT
jgi:antitoxin HicB